MSMGRGFEGVPEELGGMLVGLEMGEFDEPRAAAPAPLVVSGTPAGASRSAALFGAQPAVAQASVALVGSEKLELLQLADRRLLGDLARSTREGTKCWNVAASRMRVTYETCTQPSGSLAYCQSLSVCWCVHL